MVELVIKSHARPRCLVLNLSSVQLSGRFKNS